ncbi:hypothetical protein GT354_38225 [Streptomyces sp. SID3343]|nr:hypothetical protein [Streptomyces sp. SID3343]
MGCFRASTPAPDTGAGIEVDAASALADQPVHLRVIGLTAGETVTVSSSATDFTGRRWRGQARFRADDRGEVALDSAAPLAGTYRGADGMGLFWSMNPVGGDPERSWFRPAWDVSRRSYAVNIVVTGERRRPTTRTLTRRWLADGVGVRLLTPATDGFWGELFLPPPGTPRHPAVLMVGGSEGGASLSEDAALLASRGYPALSLGYFALPGLPANLDDIPLEYFAGALRLLARQPSVDADHVIVMGYSRGTEAALLLGQNYPDLVHGVIAYSPTIRAAAGSWTKDGRPIAEGVIPLDHVDAPVLAIAGSEDLLSPSAQAARELDRALDAAGTGRPHRALIYQGAGHGVGTFPYLAAGTRLDHPILRSTVDLGGTRAADAAARAAGWREVTGVLAGLTR